MTLKLLFIAAVALPLMLAARWTQPAHQAASKRISADYRAEQAACAPLAAQAVELCFEQARARMRLARGELEYGNGANVRDHHKMLEARAATGDALAAPRPDRVLRLVVISAPLPAAVPLKASAF